MFPRKSIKMVEILFCSIRNITIHNKTGFLVVSNNQIIQIGSSWKFLCVVNVSAFVRRGEGHSQGASGQNFFHLVREEKIFIYLCNQKSKKPYKKVNCKCCWDYYYYLFFSLRKVNVSFCKKIFGRRKYK